MNSIKQIIQQSIQVKNGVLNDELILSTLNSAINLIQNTLSGGQQVFLCGNGGSAADALHIAAEFSGRFYLNRKALPVEALSVNMAAITAIANDYGFEMVYSRMLESKAKRGDVLWLFSTSGSSLNIIEAAKKAKEMGVQCIAFTGERFTELDDLVDIVLKIPSAVTPRIQECHLMLGHVICEIVEKKMFNE